MRQAVLQHLGYPHLRSCWLSADHAAFTEQPGGVLSQHPDAQCVHTSACACTARVPAARCSEKSKHGQPGCSRARSGCLSSANHAATWPCACAYQGRNRVWSPTVLHDDRRLPAHAYSPSRHIFALAPRAHRGCNRAASFVQGKWW